MKQVAEDSGCVWDSGWETEAGTAVAAGTAGVAIGGMEPVGLPRQTVTATVLSVLQS